MSNRETEKPDSRVHRTAGASQHEMSTALRTRIIQNLESSAEADSATLQRLQAARRQALEALSAKSAGTGADTGTGLLGGLAFRSAGLAFVCILGLSTLVFLQSDQLPTEEAVLASDEASNGVSNTLNSGLTESSASFELDLNEGSLADEQIELLADESFDLEFYASLDFYEWLDIQEA